jgi:hypothetical protein
VGAHVGAKVGAKVGMKVGRKVGLRVGLNVGLNVGNSVGLNVGARVGQGIIVASHMDCLSLVPSSSSQSLLSFSFFIFANILSSVKPDFQFL